MTAHKNGKVTCVLNDANGLSLVVDRDGSDRIEVFTLDDVMIDQIHQSILDYWRKDFITAKNAKALGLVAEWKRKETT